MTIDRKIADFVDRTSEMNRFRDLIGRKSSQSILFVSGDGGIGKSSLLARMAHECAVQSVRQSRITWTETRNHDYLAIMRGLRDELGAVHFTSFTTLVNAYFDDAVKLELNVNATGSIRVAEGAQVDQSNVNTIAGVVVRDCMITIPRRDLGVSENERMLRLTDGFLNDLAALTQKCPIVLFFDAVEKMTAETLAWMWNEFMPAVRDEKVTNALCVHFGRVRPGWDRDMSRAVEQTELGPLAIDDIEEYLQKRGVMCGAPREFATLLLTVTKGRPLEVASTVDLYEMQQAQLARTAAK